MRICGSCCTKCCVCAVFLQIAAVLSVIALIPAAYLSYEFYLKPWGEAQLSRAAANGNIVSPGLSCADCAGVNLEFPVSASKGDGSVTPVFSSFEVYLINNGGGFVSAFAFAGVVSGGISLVVSLLAGIAASSSSTSSSGSAVSSITNSSGNLLFGALLMVSQGQFITLLGSLNLQGAPRFFYEFCSKFAWTNLQVFFPKDISAESGRRTLLAMGSSSQDTTVKGVQRYAQLVGVSPDRLFYYTCLAVVCACGLIAVLYLLLRTCARLCKKDHEPIAHQLDNRVVWATILLLLVFQYTLAMTSCSQIHFSLTKHRATGGLILALCVLAGSCCGFVAFGVFKISKHTHELDDLGSQAHEKKPFNRKYGVYYGDFNLANKYFFVPTIALEILSGVIVGFLQESDVMTQIALLVALNVAFLVLVIIREPYLVRYFYYASVFSGFLRVVLLLLTVIESSPDVVPQRTRNLVAELIIGINALLFLCLLIKQFCTMVVGLYTWCQSTASANRSSSSGSSISWGSSRSSSNSNSIRSKGKGSSRSGGYEPRFTLQELIASKIRDEPSPVTPPRHGTPPASRQPYQDNPNHRFV